MIRNPFREETFMEKHGTKVAVGVGALAIIGLGIYAFNSNEEREAAEKRVKELENKLSEIIEISLKKGAIGLGTELEAAKRQFKNASNTKDAEEALDKLIELTIMLDQDILLNHIRSVMKRYDRLSYDETTQEILVNGKSYGIVGANFINYELTNEQIKLRKQICEALNEISDEINTVNEENECANEVCKTTVIKVATPKTLVSVDKKVEAKTLVSDDKKAKAKKDKKSDDKKAKAA